MAMNFSMKSLTAPPNPNLSNSHRGSGPLLQEPEVRRKSPPLLPSKNVGVGTNPRMGLGQGPISVGSVSVSNNGPLPNAATSSSSPGPVPEKNNKGQVSVPVPSTSPTNNGKRTPAPAPVPQQSKIVSQNVNGTPLTGIPRTDSELQLFRVLQRANLLSYFDVMIELGGDDVQQLCEAGEEEFLEIMALIGMASKPLHVRRLQKALQEWMTNPVLFQSPVLPPTPAGTPTPTPTALPSLPRSLSPPTANSNDTVIRTSPQPQGPHSHLHHPIRPVPFPPQTSTASSAPSAAMAMVAAAAAAQQQQHAAFSYFSEALKQKLHVATNSHQSSNGFSNSNSNSNSPNSARRSPSSINGSIRIPVDQLIPSHFLETRIRTGSEPNSPAASEDSGNSHSPIPFLQENELLKVAEAAAQIVKTLPPYVFEPQVPSKRKFSGDFEMIMRLPPNDPRRFDEIRKMSTVYGRPDPNCSTHPNKRKYPKPLNAHELLVNEAAAHLARLVPTLLTYRDELCALAKQVVRDAGLHGYSSHSHLNSYLNNNHNGYLNQNHSKDGNGSGANKRIRADGMGSSSNGMEIQIQEYMRPPSNSNSMSNGNISPDRAEASLQITPIRNLNGSRRSSSHDTSSPHPLELVAVTSNSPRNSPHRQSPSSLSSESQSADPYNMTKGHIFTSVPVSGGSIRICHDLSITGTSSTGSPSPSIKRELTPE